MSSLHAIQPTNFVIYTPENNKSILTNKKKQEEKEKEKYFWAFSTSF